MVPPSGCSREIIGGIIGVKSSSTLQVTLCGGSMANDINVYKADG